MYSASSFFDVFDNLKNQVLFFCSLIGIKLIVTQVDLASYVYYTDLSISILHIVFGIAALNCFMFYIVALVKGSQRTSWWENNRKHDENQEQLLGIWMRSLAASVLVLWFGCFILMAIHFTLLLFSAFLLFYFTITILRQWKTRSA